MSFALAMANIQAQDYQINFGGTGASSTVDSVNIQNLTQCTNVKLGSGDILHLVGSAGINDINASNEKILFIYPNPFTEYCNIEFDSPVSGNATIGIYNITGKIIIETQNNLQQGNHKYLISGIKSGIYFIHIKSKAYSYYGKLINNCIENGIAKITYQSQIANTTTPNYVKNTSSGKSTTSIINMQYTVGDRLKLTGFSEGIYRTIFMLIPTSSQTVTFNFVACPDADGNNYSVVQIGTQIWMAENLKTTKYRSGTSIQNITNDAQWFNYSYGAYCNYNNTTNTDTINTYGRLYNWYAVADNIAPTGWHVPSDAEWTTLINYLGGESIAGGKLKENCTSFCLTPNVAATNETGFTALSGGIRDPNPPNGPATFESIGYSGYWWSTTNSSSTSYYIWVRSINCNGSSVFRTGGIGYGFKNDSKGYSVRCVKD